MKRFLIVEDQVEAIAIVADYLTQDRFPGSTVLKAGAVDEAMTMLTETFTNQFPLDAVILDFKLPKTLGSPPEVDTSLWAYVRSFRPDAIIAHITGYPSDPKILDHLAEMHLIGSDRILNPDSPLVVMGRYGFVVPKTSSLWVEKLADGLERFARLRRFERMLDDVLAPEFRGVCGPYPPSAPLAGYSLTHRLAELLTEAGELWPDLEPRVRDRLKQTFRVVEPTASGEPARLALL
jgi:CheY-like chemotaxis protein